MTDDQRSALREFFKSTEKLKELGIIRSSRYLGDIGEFICKEEFDVVLEDDLRAEGHDARDGDGHRVQVKFSNSKKSNNINVGNPNKYDKLIVIIGFNSKLKETDHNDASEFRAYFFESSEVKQWVTEKESYYCAKEKLKSCQKKVVVV